MPTEIDKICSVVDMFASAVKKRMIEKHAEGKRGWDGDFSLEEIATDLLLDSLFLHRVERLPGLKHVACKHKTATDIAARAMMIWYRDPDRLKNQNPAGAQTTNQYIPLEDQ